VVYACHPERPGEVSGKGKRRSLVNSENFGWPFKSGRGHHFVLPHYFNGVFKSAPAVFLCGNAIRQRTNPQTGHWPAAGSRRDTAGFNVRLPPQSYAVFAAQN